MGGKNKTSQRTKNNARPSSSGRSAELLANAPATFAGFSGVETKAMPMVFPLSADATDSDLSMEFLLVIKKMNKKDPITKTKALIEMTELVKESSIEEITRVLPYWSRLYCTLTNDTEHKVREATQSTHGVIVNKCGRSIAPHLKQLIPTWLTAQYDVFAPAASHAQVSLKGAFPESKLPEVITFCKAEMMNNISGNLITDGQVAFLNNRAVEPSVLEMRHERIRMSTLQGYDFFTKYLPAKHDEWLWAEQLPILDSGKFWKLSSDKSSHIRGAWFGVIARQIERFPKLFGEKYGSKATKVLVNNLIEKDPLVAMQLWECFLLLTAHIKNWYSWVDKKELLDRRILDVLENGGWGNATHLAAIILPLLANLPTEMLTKEFYSQFFIAMINGLNKKAILASKSHRQACITSIGECIKYVSINEIETFAVEIITSALRTWLEKILESPYESRTRSNIIKHSAVVMVSLMKYWLRQSEKNKCEKYDQLVRNFWQNKCSTIVCQIEKLGVDRVAIERSVEGHILLLQSLKSSFVFETKKHATIKFEIDQQPDDNIQNTGDVSEIDTKLQENYIHNLNNVIHIVCSQYLQYADKKEITSPIFVPLYTLLCEFDSRELFVAIAKDFTNDKAKEASLYGLYDGVFRRWLSGDTMRCKEVVHMTFLLVPHMSSEEQEAVFRSFNQFVPSVVEEIISKCLSHPYSSLDYVRQWMKSDVVDVTLAAICKRLVKSGDSYSKNLLLMSFSQDRNGDIIISEKACSSILLVLCDALKDLKSDYLDMCASLASQLVTVLLTEDKTDAYKALLLQMFKLNSTIKLNNENLSEDTWWELKTSWQDGLSTMADEERRVFIENGVKLIHQALVTDRNDVDTKKVDDIIELATSLLNKFNENYEAEENLVEIVTIAKALFEEKDDVSTSTADNVEVHALRYDLLNGRLNFLYDDQEATKHIINTADEEKAILLSRPSLNSYIYKSLTRAKYLCAVVNGPQKKPEDTEEGVTEEDIDKALAWSSTVLSDPHIRDEYLNSLYNYVVLKTLDEAYAFWPHHSIISENREILGSYLKEIISNMSKETEERYLKSLTVKASTEGFYWPYAQKCFQQLTNQDALQHYFNEQDTTSNNMECRLRNVGNFHCLHASCDILKPEAYCRARCKIMLHCFHAWHQVDPASVSEPLDGDRLDFEKIIRKYNPPSDDVTIDIMNEPWKKLVSSAAMLDALSAFVIRHGWSMSEKQWDAVVLALCSYTRAVNSAKLWWGSTKVVLVGRAVLKLMQVVQSFVRCALTSDKSDAPRAEPPQGSHVRALLDEWVDLVSVELASHVYSIILGVLGTTPETSLGANHMVFLKGLSQVVHQMRWRTLPEDIRSDQLSLSSIKQVCLGVLRTAGHHSLKYLSYYVLKGLVRDFADDDFVKMSEWCAANADTEEITAKPKFSITTFAMVLSNLEMIVDTELSPVRMGEDSCVVVPFTDSYSITLSYLLVVEFMLDICASADSDVQQQYIEFFRTGNYVELLMSNCIRMLPREVVERAREPTRAPPVPTDIADMFTVPHTFTVTEPPLASHVAGLACRCLLLVLGGVGSAAARGWYGTLSGRLSKTIDNVVSVHVTPAILRPMFNAVQEGIEKLDDITVTAAWSSYEVNTQYVLDEARTELLLTFHSNHPLAIPKVESLRTPVNYSQWISFYLSYQNGTILQAIRLWSDALARKVEGATPCYVCYSRLHPQTGQLPKVHCTVCNNRFHNKCIYKWFRTSGRSSCPLCRSLF